MLPHCQLCLQGSSYRHSLVVQLDRLDAKSGRRRRCLHWFLSMLNNTHNK